MAQLEWTEDYTNYKKGEKFIVNDPDTIKYYTETGKVKVVDEKITVDPDSPAAKQAEEEKAAAKKATK